MKNRFPLAGSSWDESELKAIQKVIDSDRYTMGEYVEAFEEAFAEYVGTDYCVMVNSGSSANLLMIAALFYSSEEARRLKRGDEIIVPAVSWSTTYFPLYQYGLRLKFVDIDVETLNYDLDALALAVSDNTRAVMIVNLLGNPNNFDKIKSIVSERNILLLEDNCESMGAEYNGQKTGSFGLMGSFSCFFSHHISTMEGGIISTNDEELYHILLALRAHGWTRNLPKYNRVCGKKSDNQFDEMFRFVLPGYNVRPLEMSGAIGLEQLKKLPEMINIRRDNAKRMTSAFSNHSEITLQREIGLSSWFGFSLVIKEGSTISRDFLIDRLISNGFECRPIVSGNFVKNEVVKRYFDYEIFDRLHNAEYIDRNGVMIGNHHYSMDETVKELTYLLEEA